MASTMFRQLFRRMKNAPSPEVESVTLAAPYASNEAQSLILAADKARDARQWTAAAELYCAALNLQPDLAAIWVQFGNMKKEAGAPQKAEEAYRRALELSGDVADTYVQLGRALQFQGRHQQAFSTYLTALRIDRNSQAALGELVKADKGWLAEAESGAGERSLARLLHAVEQSKRALSRIEDALPALASLSSIPVSEYALYRRRFTLPLPPMAARQSWAVIVIGSPLAAAGTVASAKQQTHTPARVVFVPDDGPAPVLPACDWLVFVEAGVQLDPLAIAWLDWAATHAGVAALQADERFSAGSESEGEMPLLKAAFDPETCVPSGLHGLIAMRLDFAQSVVAQAWVSQDKLSAFAELAGPGQIAHLARILATRNSAVISPALPRSLPSGGAGGGKIAIVIPTRDGGEMLRRCIYSLFDKAHKPDRLVIIVLDNGPADPSRYASIQELCADGAVRILRDPSPFNFSDLCNRGARESAADILVFANDDIELISKDWDSLFERHLARPEIGMVGARLIYPDGSLQHAGMVFGPDGRAEHEGVAAIGVPDYIAARWRTRRRVAAVTGALMACRAETYHQVGGMDPAFPIWFNDVDLCLKIRGLDQFVLYEPEIEAFHHESRSLASHGSNPVRQDIWNRCLDLLRARWGQALRYDPSFNPQFARTGRPFEALAEPSIETIRHHLIASVKAP